MPQPIRSRYADSKDKLIIEDELQRIFVVGDLKCETSVTGRAQSKTIVSFFFSNTINQ